MKNQSVYLIAHLSDSHVLPEGELLRGSLDTASHLARALALIEEAGQPLDALLFTGDVIEHGGAAAYRRVQDLVQPFAERLGVPVIYVVGNHDEKGDFQEVLLGGAPFHAVHRIGGLRIIVLDSTVAGSAAGDLPAAELDWLAEQLRTPAEHGTLLALHHPPLPGTSTLIERVALAPSARHALGEVVAGTDVRLIAAGHYHQPTGGVLRGIPVWVSGALAYTSEAYPPPGVHRGLRLPSLSRLEIHPDTAFGVFQPLLVDVVYTQPVRP
jgi:3',5'-cyclic-AMP phosphodiesterase